MAAADFDTPAHRYTSDLAGVIELRWQDHWDENHSFDAPNPAGPLAGDERIAAEDKLYVLDMFPYPSGTGLHVGHPLGYIGTDVYCRFKRMTGHNVCYTMGFDAFGLPAEQYAVQTGQHPAVTTAANVANMRRQLRRLGLSHDARRSIDTTDPSYYRWTQWIFLQIFDAWYDTDQDRARPIAELVEEWRGGTRAMPDGQRWDDLSASAQRVAVDAERLAYVADAPVNWCPGLGTVVANEEVTADGRSDRGNFPVFTRTMRQWMMRITRYADRLIDDLDLLDWSEAIKTMQRNWIGRSEGARIRFSSPAGEIEVFTTRPDTLFGATFLVLAPEHPLVGALAMGERVADVDAYCREANARKDVDRADAGRAKTGVFTGSFAINPATGDDIPVWVADYVLMGYGSGAIMAVPCGDQRDFEFARAYGLEIPAIQEPPPAWFEAHGIEAATTTEAWPEAFVGDGRYVNSSNSDGLDLDGLTSVATGTCTVNAWLEARGRGERTVNYKLRDWLFSRQRYWGEPFPIVHDEHGPVALPDSALPVVLPDTTSFAPRTFDPDDRFSDPESPLDRLDDWTEVELDLGDGARTYRRDTNVMPQWAGSCWYELRYLDPTNEEVFVDPAVEQYWMGPRPTPTGARPHPGGADLYVGGVEHAVLHLLYSRFWHKVLHDLGHVSSSEPFYRLFNQGMILAAAFKDGRGVYVDALEVAERDGAFVSADGEPVTREWGKMGKSLKNAVSPDDMYDAFGADTLRLYEMSTGPMDASRPWETRDVVGMFRFLQRLWRNVVSEDTGELRLGPPAEPDTLRLLHRTIDAVAGDFDTMRFNTAIAKLIELNNALTKLGRCPVDVAEPLVLMVAPLCPHLAEELWSRLGHTASLIREPFPVADQSLLLTSSIELPVQVNGKFRSRIVVATDATGADIEAAALADDRVIQSLNGTTPTKVIVVPGRTVNIVVRPS